GRRLRPLRRLAGARRHPRRAAPPGLASARGTPADPQVARRGARADPQPGPRTHRRGNPRPHRPQRGDLPGLSGGPFLRGDREPRRPVAGRPGRPLRRQRIRRAGAARTPAGPGVGPAAGARATGAHPLLPARTFPQGDRAGSGTRRRTYLPADQAGHPARLRLVERAYLVEPVMQKILGSLIIVACVLGGYALASGDLAMLWQPAELLIIVGAAFGSLV